MAKTLLKIQRYFRRKPVRFFSLILLYLTAGSLVFLHAGFIGESGPGGRRRRDKAVASGNPDSLSEARGLGIIRRGFKERTGRRYGPPWMKKTGEERQEAARRGGDYTTNWNRALKGRNAKDVDDGRGGSNAPRSSHTVNRAGFSCGKTWNSSPHTDPVQIWCKSVEMGFAALFNQF